MEDRTTGHALLEEKRCCWRIDASAGEDRRRQEVGNTPKVEGTHIGGGGDTVERERERDDGERMDGKGKERKGKKAERETVQAQ